MWTEGVSFHLFLASFKAEREMVHLSDTLFSPFFSLIQLAGRDRPIQPRQTWEVIRFSIQEFGILTRALIRNPLYLSTGAPKISIYIQKYVPVG